MYLKRSLVLLMMSLTLGCSIFKKDVASSAATTAPKVVSNTPLLNGDTIQSDTSSFLVIDTIVPPIPPKQALEYMTIEEKAMIDEINILRSDPNSYIRHVDAYLQDFMEDSNWGIAERQAERSAAEEVIRELRNMPPLPLIEPSEALYKVAEHHGMEMKENGVITHRGNDDTQPEDRIRDSTDLVGRENLVAGGRSMRESVIMLLVDANDRASRSHRKTILSPTWEFAAFYYAGTINEIPNVWVQLYGYKDPNEIPKEPTIRTLPEMPKEETEKTTSETEMVETVNTNKPEVTEKEGRANTSTKNDKQDTSASLATGNFSFMSVKEKAMIDEINLMRSNPKGYIKYVDEFIVAERKNIVGNRSEFDRFAKELKKQLRKTKKLSNLKPHQKLHEAAKAHGLYNKVNHQMEHVDANGGEGFDRVEKTGLKNSINSKGEYAPNENLVGGYASIRNTVIYLLIDTGEPDRGHRKALLEPTWEYVACYNVGTIEKMKDGFGRPGKDMPHNWIQFFAKGPDANAPVKTSTPVVQPKVNEGSTTVPTATGDFSFITLKEKEMVEEINLVRSNPKAYVKRVNEYVEEVRGNMIGDLSMFDQDVEELKRELEQTAPLSILEPHKKLYEVLKKHGRDNKDHHQMEHKGSDGRSSFQRVREAGLRNMISSEGILSPNENISIGEPNIRNIVVSLLIDSGIPSRGHRKALLEPTWKYVACYEVGIVKQLKDFVEMGKKNTDGKHCWFQFFGKE